MTEDIQQRVDYFVKQLLGPIALAAAFEVFVQTQDRAPLLTWIANAAILAYIFGRFYKDSSVHELKWAAALSGVVISLITAVAKIIFFKEIWYVFNAFTEPLIVAAIMGSVAYVAGTLMRKSAHFVWSIKKGGES